VRLLAALELAVYFVRELFVSNYRVTQDVLGPLERLRPGVIAIPLDLETDLEIALLSNLLTITPGTLTLDLSEDRKTMYIHAMRVEEGEAVRKSVKEGFERRIMRVTR
jgi:multicomponent Na+:H+ antiporter subunit E